MIPKHHVFLIIGDINAKIGRVELLRPTVIKATIMEID